MRKITVPTKIDKLPSRLREGLAEGSRPKLALRYGGAALPRPIPQAGGES